LSERVYWVGLSQVPGIGAIRLRELVAHFGSSQAVWSAPLSALRAAGLDLRTATTLVESRPKFDEAKIFHAMERAGVRAVLFDDPDYPPLLKLISDAPAVLYVKGTLSNADRRAVAFCGTRTATEYGKTMTTRLVAPLAESGIPIVSGLTRGIDTSAHLAALEANGRTIAVLPGGLDVSIPPESLALAERIVAQGALISECPLGVPVKRFSFTPRARLISGLSLAVVIVEAGETSGALKTADAALDQGREVFAVPGNALSPSSAGTNMLIQAGAGVITDAAHLLEALSLQTDVPALPRPQIKAVVPPSPIKTPPPVAYQPQSAGEAAVLHQLRQGAAHIDDLAHACSLPIHEITSILTVLELNNVVEQVGVLKYAIHIS